MGKKLLNIFYFFLGLGLIASVVIGIYYLFKTAWTTFMSLDPPVSAALITGSVTALVAVLSLILTKLYERKKEIEQSHRTNKLPLYEEFISFYFKLLMSSKTGQPVSEAEMIEFHTKFTQKLILWGSDDVISAYANFRRVYLNLSKYPPNELLLQFEKIMLALRKDTGHKNKKLNTGDLLSLFVNDIDDFLEKNKAAS
ncbi:hypothetical protein [Brevibacillus sp. FIR094]|uniref:hypothetical protein n=1 Tax=Brevibacillus sp. FIR094 TaxID=3134809 RepID=UPI003D23E221